MTREEQALGAIEQLIADLKAQGASPLYAPDIDVLTAIGIHGGNRPGTAATDLSRHLAAGKSISATQAADIKSALDAYTQMTDPPIEITDAMNAIGGEATHRWTARIVNDWRIKSDELPEPSTGLSPGVETKADGSQHRDGAMIALIPRDEDVPNWTVDDGLTADDLHVTLVYLGDAADIPAQAVTAMANSLSRIAEDFQAQEPRVAGQAKFNPGGDNPADVILLNSPGIEDIHNRALTIAQDNLGDVLAEQHRPYIPHMTLSYDEGPGALMLALPADTWTKPLVFDRIALVIGTDITEFTLTGDGEKAVVRTRKGALRYNAPIGTPLKRSKQRIRISNSQPSKRVTAGWIRSGFATPTGGGLGPLGA